MSFGINDDYETDTEKLNRLNESIKREEAEAKQHTIKQAEEKLQQLKEQNEKSRNPFPYDDRF